MEKKMRNWTSFILAIVASVVMVLITLFSMDYLVTIVNEGGANQQQLEQIIALFKIVYLVIVIIFAIINALFGVWSIFKKGGCTALLVFGIILLVLGGVFIFLIPFILDLIAYTKGKKKFEEFEREQKALAARESNVWLNNTKKEQDLSVLLFFYGNVTPACIAVQKNARNDTKSLQCVYICYQCNYLNRNHYYYFLLEVY